jgi:5,10-methylenetetrahydrofolate reductase
VYSVESFQRLAERLAGSGVPVLAGLLAPRTAEQLTNVIAAVPGVKVPEWFAAAVREGGPAAGLELLAATVRELREVAAGIHIMPMGSPEAVLRLAAAAGVTRRPSAAQAGAGGRPRFGGEVS